jgi:hypothetical protein
MKNLGGPEREGRDFQLCRATKRAGWFGQGPSEDLRVTESRGNDRSAGLADGATANLTRFLLTTVNLLASGACRKLDASNAGLTAGFR